MAKDKAFRNMNELIAALARTERELASGTLGVEGLETACGDAREHLGERHHDVECHGVHPLRAVQGDKGDTGSRAVDEDEIRRTHRCTLSRAGPPANRQRSWVGVCLAISASMSSSRIWLMRSSSAAGGSAPAVAKPPALPTATTPGATP